MVVGGSRQETLGSMVTSLTVKLGDTGSNPSRSVRSLKITGESNPNIIDFLCHRLDILGSMMCICSKSNNTNIDFP
ncbi:unnamed protein product [Schistosoma margrebowiei]|uniref:Uncharacterized protein n=1 Tax=Schistosoma margrebowiei TaxID=48269 RepID=A0A183M1A0_9TREM|nr:unnamed protein product [Schistosoma margrebowiei]